MSEYLIQDATLTNIADAIRTKTGGTATLTPSQMASAILSISTSTGGGSSSDSNVFYISKQVTVEQVTQGNFVTLISGNSQIAANWNNPNLFVMITPDNLDAIDIDTYSNAYQWTTMIASNKPMVVPEDESYTWYGVGIYLMTGKSYTYPSTLEIPYSLNNTDNTNYSYLNVTENGDVRVYICSYDVLASGQYTVTIGLL